MVCVMEENTRNNPLRYYTVDAWSSLVSQETLKRGMKVVFKLMSQLGGQHVQEKGMQVHRYLKQRSEVGGIRVLVYETERKPRFLVEWRRR